MSTSARAHLVYGYDLGSAEHGWQLVEARESEYGGQELILPWFVSGSEDDDVEDSEEGIDTLGNEFLLKASGFHEVISRELPDYYELRKAAIADIGVTIGSFNHHEVPRYALYAIASEVEADTGGVTNFEAPTLVTMAGWGIRLKVALRTLGITPTQDRPGWLLYPNYS